jgi:hypothetical protein
MKRLFILFALLFCTAALFADSEDAEYFEEDLEERESVFEKNRTIEFGFGVDVGMANNFLSANEIFTDVLVIDLTKLKDGLDIYLGGNAQFFFNYNRLDDWGFGLFSGADFSAAGNISGALVNFEKNDKDDFGFGGAVFAETGATSFFHVKNFKVRLGSTFYYPIAYVEPGLSYTYIARDDYLKLSIDYDMAIYTAFSLAKDREGGLSGHIGFDLDAGVEYPLFPFVTVGVFFEHIPIVPSELEDYMLAKGSFGIETYDIINDMQDDIDKILHTGGDDMEYGKGSVSIVRPFKMLFTADFQPLYFIGAAPKTSRLLTLHPFLGLNYNSIYTAKVAPEGGVKIRSNVGSILLATITMLCYEDMLWKNGIDLAVDLRAFELDFGIGMQAQSFAKSWTAAGVDVSIGMKFGW